MALPIYVMYDLGVTEAEARAIIDGVNDVTAEFFPGRRLYNFGSSPWCEGDFSSADWYVRKARKIIRQGFPLQIDAGHLADIIIAEPWQRQHPHIDLCFTSLPLTARMGPGKGELLNFCFGITRGRVVVNSVAAYRNLYAKDRETAIRAVVWHELGHVFGLAGDSNRPNTEYNLGMHCTRHGCAMRQGLSVSEWVRHAKEAAASGIYCEDCRRDARMVNW